MAGFLENVHKDLRRLLDAALDAALAAGDLSPREGGERPAYALEVPKERQHGDFATNLALVAASWLGAPPRRIAAAVADRLPVGTVIERVEVAGPGFINIFMRPGWLAPVVDAILSAGEAYGRTERGAGQRVQVEFVSANPTGPLNVVNARAAAFGDALANVLAASGCRVEREYYVNDAGNQFEKLALAMEIRCRQLLGQEVELPEDAYPGAYVIDLARSFLEAPEGAEARELLSAHPPAPPGRDCAPEVAALRERLGRYAVERIVAEQEAVLADYGVVYDVWYRESAVRAAGGPQRALELLRERGCVYERDGAVWFRSTDFGDDQDRVLVRQNGEMTYFLADIAYHLTKFERGFDRVIDIWGQDHHGYAPRLRAALQALGHDPGALEVLLTQLVRLVRGGQVVKMSKRRGEFVTMEEFLADVGRDAARFFFLMRSIDSHMDFDIDLARTQAAENPVYYVQYAHARICSILRQAADQGWPPPRPGGADLSLLRAEAEAELMRKMAAFPAEVRQAAERREPHRLTVYARELATLFHAFYTQCRVLGEDPALTAARLALVAAARQVLANTLALIGVSAPERM